MILLTNGCSWTWGSGLELDSNDRENSRSRQVWPYHLSKMLGCESVTNLAVGCGSNDRICRTTYDWLTTQAPQDQKIIAVIQWTEPHRFEYYVPLTKNIKENIPEQWARAKINWVISNEEWMTQEEKVSRVNRYLETWTDTQAAYKMLIQTEFLSKIFKDCGVEFYYWNLAYGASRAPDHIRSRLHQHPWLDDDVKTGKDIWQYETVSNTNKHPSAQGHRQIAQIIWNKIKSKPVDIGIL